MKNYHRNEYLLEINHFQEWTDETSKQRQGPAGIQGHLCLENWAKIPDEEKFGHCAVDCKACAKMEEYGILKSNQPFIKSKRSTS